jgi:hypothetical protein
LVQIAHRSAPTVPRQIHPAPRGIDLLVAQARDLSVPCG